MTNSELIINTHGSRIKSIVALGSPMLVSSLSMLLVGMVDAAVVGRLGIEKLAGAATAIAVFAVATECLAAVGIGYQIAVARCLGAQNFRDAQRFRRQFAVLSTGVTAVILVALTQARPLVDLLADSPQVGAIAFTYLLFRSPSLLIMTVTLTLRVPFDAAKKTYVGMLSALTSNAINVFAAPVLVFGLGPIPAIGIAGAGLAGTLGGLSGLILIVFFAYKADPLSFPNNHSAQITPISSGFLDLSKFELINVAADYIGNLVFIGIIAHLGVAALALHRIAFSLLLIVFVICSSLATACQILMARSFGAQNEAEASALFRVGLVLLLSIGALIAVFSISFPGEIMWLYTGSTNLLPKETGPVQIIGLTVPVLALNAMLVAWFRSQRHSKTVMWINIGAVWLVQIPWAFIAVKNGLGLAITYAGITLYFAARAAVGAAILLRKTTKQPYNSQVPISG